MRKSTRKKLFRDADQPRILMEFDVGDGFGTLLVINGRTAIVQEYKNEADGFELWIPAPGRTIDDARSALGFPPPVRSLGQLLAEDEEANK